ALDAGIKESTGSAESSVVDSDRKANSFVDSQPEPFTPDPTPSEQTLPSATSPSTETITPGDRIIVVGKLKDEDTDWVINELPDWQHAIYTVDDPEATLRPPKNKGRESNVYLQYIIDNYDNLPSIIVFLHSHRDGYPRAWHTEFEEHDNVLNVRMLQLDFIQRNGYANLRCNFIPGCPDEIQPFRNPRDEWRTAEHAFADAWRALFNNSDIPEVVATPCCSQFAVSSAQVRKRPLSSYIWFQKWLLETELPDDVSGRIMEYLWHIIFGQDPV
ncbi:hypothetical protein T310_8486, partial [Rasamsonia emersonii CBS 393.64]